MNKKQYQWLKFKELADSKIWSLNSLVKAINRILPNNISLTKGGLIRLISNQMTYRVFRNIYKRNLYYIFVPIMVKNPLK